MKKQTYITTRFDVDDEFYVEVVSYVENREEWADFYVCNDKFGIKDFMFVQRKELCPENTWEELINDEIESWIKTYKQDVGVMDLDNYDSVFELIDSHNNHVDTVQDLAEALLKKYPKIEETSIDEVFGNMWESMAAMAIRLCCEANELEEEEWYVTDDLHVVREEDVEDLEDYSSRYKMIEGKN